MGIELSGAKALRCDSVPFYELKCKRGVMAVLLSLARGEDDPLAPFLTAYCDWLRETGSAVLSSQASASTLLTSVEAFLAACQNDAANMVVLMRVRKHLLKISRGHELAMLGDGEVQAEIEILRRRLARSTNRISQLRKRQ